MNNDYIVISGNPKDKNEFSKYAVLNDNHPNIIEIISWNPVEQEKSSVIYTKEELTNIMNLFNRFGK